ncbi:ABC transporter ATP-binding protein [Vagococcus carniphilus]|uniref:ABC transporter ATP-binding protein n=1 Tax=Vagococcus carniphilus TaxID=218144 RepID=A0AAW8U8K2_9ENTE|nr:ABC transporter ATP-binding protein [Vagococcus carniphilus]MDT2831806.1 ABC transporter ATP-binding protein [Vagococcus carniphilus]MDT2834114.1 ABC transporter ATP-binding protein [Vagococcus carniphilus]MDT2840659.1 ABC transporter ATP-binding protein [Vagococcus carniphilus]MDT2855316.1 ABC transporter ATP-binding protein [Vagococcus carniphilus]
MLELKNVSKNFKETQVLNDINLTFENGVYGLLAPNGAGKTTLIKMITTLLFPSSGEILWDGRSIVDLGRVYRGNFGYLPQDFGYYGNYTPEKFLMYLSVLQKMDKKVAKKRVDELLDLVALSHVKRKKMKTFSGGMIQRVGIAQAMLNNPKLLVLDEPTAGLDPKERVRFRNLLHQLAKDRIIILSTHIVSDIETIANQIILLKNHEVYLSASPEEVIQTVQGKIFEIPSNEQVGSEQFVLSERQTTQGAVLRMASESQIEKAKVVTPTLEDAFLYIYRDEV